MHDTTSRFAAAPDGEAPGWVNAQQHLSADAGRITIDAVHPFARALSLYLIAGLCLSSLDATAKFLVQDNALFLVVWARYAGQMLVVTPFAWRRGGPSFWRTKRLGLQIVRSCCLMSATITFFAALRYLPLAEASAVTFMAPLFIVVLSRPMLGERPTMARAIAAVVGFIGILILLRPGSSIFHPAALLLIVSALSNALYYMLTRKLADESAYTTLFYSALVGTVAWSLALPWQLADGALASRSAAWLLLPGLFAGLGHWFVISAYQRAPASLLGPFSYLQIIWATLYGYLLFSQLPDRWSAVGMAVIVASGLLLALQERRRLS